MSATDEARAEAERRWPTRHVHIPGPLGATTYPADNPRADGFVAGAEWQASRGAVSLDDHLQSIRQGEAEGLHSPAFEAGYQAVYDSGALTGDVYRNAAIWHAVMAALKAALPADAAIEAAKGGAVMSETCARCGEPITVRMGAWVHVQSDGSPRVFCAGGEPYGEMAQPADRPINN